MHQAPSAPCESTCAQPNDNGSLARASAELIALGIPVFCRGVTPNSAFPSGPGEVALPLAMGEVTVDAGDLVIGAPDVVGARLEVVATTEMKMHAEVQRVRSVHCWIPYLKLRDRISYLD